MNPVDVHGANILIADDQEANLELLESLLKEEGYIHIHTTRDPEQIFELHQEHNFDLILLDMEISGTDGFQVMKKLQTNIDDPYLSLIIFTANPEHKLRALQAGAKDFISKPFDLVEVVTRMRNILEVRLLYKKLEDHVKELELQIEENTAELRESEARFRGFTELSSDWYWEQDHSGNFTKVSGPVPAILGIEVDSMAASTNPLLATGWNIDEQSRLRAKITAREPFHDFQFTRSKSSGDRQTFLVSGQPMFDRACNFLGYRGVGVDISAATIE